MKKILFYFLFYYAITLSNAQTIALIPNINSNDFGFSGNAVVFNNALYFLYNTSGMQQVARYDGNNIKLITSPSTGSCLLGPQNVYDKNLCIGLCNKHYKSQLVFYDGDKSLKWVDNPDLDYDFAGNTIMLNNDLYYNYYYGAIRKLAKYNGTNSIISLPDSISLSNSNKMIIYNNSLYFYCQCYTKGNSKNSYLANYDGTKIALIKIPNNCCEILEFTIFKDELYLGLSYCSSIKDNELAKVNKDKLMLISNPIFPNRSQFFENSGFYANFTILNNELYFYYQVPSGKIQLAKFNGKDITLIPNPDNDGKFKGNIINFNNALYLCYNSKLLKFDGIKYTIITNPDDAKGLFGDFVIYNNELFFDYVNLSGKRQLAKLIENTK